MNTISRILCAFAFALLVACDFHGPWSFYPEDREVYTGIYTYGYILDGGEANICFSKVYELDETSAENFAFYDSAYVTVSGKFTDAHGAEVDTTAVLAVTGSKPNCFSEGEFSGIAGETYSMEAFFKWDSAGSTAKTTFRAQATIPNPVSIKGLSVPQQDGSFEWIEYDENEEVRIKFLEFPLDMETVKCALNYDKSIKGVISILQYGMDSEEAQNTTINKMLSGLIQADSMGYSGVSMHDPLEREENLGYTTKQSIGGIQALDTLFLPNMMMPLGRVTVVFYTTDEAYIDYETKVKGSVADSRIVPESNIENGMGVFSGMARSTFTFYVDGEDGVPMKHVAFANCDATSDGDNKSWASRGCRLYQDVFCSGMPVDSIEQYDLMTANGKASDYYAKGEYRSEKTCFPSLVKAAMMNKEEKWSAYLPDSISDKNKSDAYADGLKRYCVASGFESNSIADCKELEYQCMESPEQNNCKEYLWNWCADRGLPNRSSMDNLTCDAALVSRYYLEEQKSSIIHDQVESLCDAYRFPICNNWCKERKGRMECE